MVLYTEKNKLNELTSADRFSRVTPIENGEDGLVTCQSRENSFTLIDNQSALFWHVYDVKY